ncbi:glycosyltransferase family-like protein, putative [Bodo saltans]|uniref:Glycosyltransferase family-like protein, putative n=1 Tax=Bodo saltans TaxID=75058 RepID=A0A0S4IK22_BODSA|nr:glycosyltransferase family-like protein, putative [Bodo saltans]|eukprot:CUF00263.1 glycosyltransferase family-like protein, putative [Bodo saltans]
MFRSRSLCQAAAVQAAAPIFDACFLLNLDRRPDKLQHAQLQMKRAKLNKFIEGGNVERVSGVDGSTLNIDTLARDGVVTQMGAERFRLPLEQKLFGMDLTPGAIGCALGHRKIWEMIVARNLKSALVLEDDIEFHPKFARSLRERWAAVPKDWGLVYFGGLDLLSKGKPPRPFVGEGIRYAYHGHRELTAYVLHAESAKRCLELSLPMTWQVDTHICNQLKQDPRAEDEYIADPLSYVFQPSLAMQVTVFGTDVQKTKAENAPLEDAARRMREFVGGATSVR